MLSGAIYYIMAKSCPAKTVPSLKSVVLPFTNR